MTSNSSNNQNVDLTAFNDVGKGDYSTLNRISLRMLESIVFKVKRSSVKNYSLELLVVISRRWKDDKQSSTLYSLCGGDTKNIHRTYGKVKRRADLVFIEVIGVGRYNSKSYAPTATGIAALEPLCNVARTGLMILS